MLISVLLTLVVIAGVLLIFYGLNRVITQSGEMEERLGQFAGRRSHAREQAAGAKESVIGVKLDRALAKQSFGQGVARDLARANLKMTVAEYMVVNALTTFFGAIAGYLLTGTAVFGVVGLVLGIFTPRLYVGRREKARRKAFNDQLGDTITLLANSLRSGYSLLQSMDMLAREASEPTSEEFLRVVREVGLGLSAEEALANLVRRVESDDLDLMVTAINIQHEVGGNLAQVLDSIGNTIRERVKIKGEITTLTAQQQYAGYIVAALPILLTLLLFLLNKEYMLPMFSGVYICMPIGGLLMIVMGFLVIRKIVAIKV